MIIRTKKDKDEDDDSPNAQSESDSSSDDDDDSSSFAPLARKPQATGGSSAPSSSQNLTEAEDDDAHLHQFETALRLKRLMAGEDVSENSVSVHTEFSSDNDDDDFPSTSSIPADRQLLVIPQPISALLAPEIQQAISSWNTSLRQPQPINLHGSSVEKVHQLAAVVQMQAALIRQLKQENVGYHLLAARKSQEIERLNVRIQNAETLHTNQFSENKRQQRSLETDVAKVLKALPDIQAKLTDLDQAHASLDKVFLSNCSSYDAKFSKLRSSIPSSKDIMDSISIAIEPLEQDIRDLKPLIPDVLTLEQRINDTDGIVNKLCTAIPPGLIPKLQQDVDYAIDQLERLPDDAKRGKDTWIWLTLLKLNLSAFSLLQLIRFMLLRLLLSPTKLYLKS